MVITVDTLSMLYPMGCSNPFPAAYQIRFGSLEFRATGNGYLMEFLHEHKVAEAPNPASPPRRRRRSGQRSQQARAERRRIARATAL